MKKILLGTSALALAGAFASPAASAEWEMRVGGYMEQHVAYATSDPDNSPGKDAEYDGVDVKSDTEIHFSPVITLDNGIKFGARIELEGTGKGDDQIDENYVYIEGSFGRLSIGEDDNAAYIMGYGAPDVTFVNINSGSESLWLPFDAAFGTTTTFISVEGDSVGLRYFSPRMAGFQVGVSYARDANRDSDDAQKDRDADLSDIFGVGANYVNSFGDFDIALSGGWTGGDAAKGDSDPEAWSAGLNLGMSGFTIGGSYADWNKAGGNMETFDLGVSYATGPWGVSFTYVHSELNDDDNGEIDKFLLGMDYKLAQGIRLGAWVVYVDADSDNGLGFTGDDEDGERNFYDGDGWIIGTGMKLNF